MQGGPFIRGMLKRDSDRSTLASNYREWNKMIEAVESELSNLGKSKYMDGPSSIPPSRFSRLTANGLWEYSPYLCAVGLVEGL